MLGTDGVFSDLQKLIQQQTELLRRLDANVERLQTLSFTWTLCGVALFILLVIWIYRSLRGKP